MMKSLNNPLDIMTYIAEIFDELLIEYFIGGSFASIIYGEYRTTQDVDIIAKINKQHIPMLIHRLHNDFYIQESEIEMAINTVNYYQDMPSFRSTFNIIHLVTGFKIDIFLPTNRPFEQSQFNRRVYEQITNETAIGTCITTAEDIILAKLEWYSMAQGVSDQQWRDVKSIIKVQAEQLDHSYLEYWAAQLGISDLLKKALQDSH